MLARQNLPGVGANSGPTCGNSVAVTYPILNLPSMFARQFTKVIAQERGASPSAPAAGTEQPPGHPFPFSYAATSSSTCNPRNGVESRFDAIGHIKAGADARVRGRLPICIEDWA